MHNYNAELICGCKDTKSLQFTVYSLQFFFDFLFFNPLIITFFNFYIYLKGVH